MGRDSLLKVHLHTGCCRQDPPVWTSTGKGKSNTGKDKNSACIHATQLKAATQDWRACMRPRGVATWQRHTAVTRLHHGRQDSTCQRPSAAAPLGLMVVTHHPWPRLEAALAPCHNQSNAAHGGQDHPIPELCLSPAAGWQVFQRLQHPAKGVWACTSPSPIGCACRGGSRRCQGSRTSTCSTGLAWADSVQQETVILITHPQGFTSMTSSRHLILG